jgi:hypothetical protein
MQRLIAIACVAGLLQSPLAQRTCRSWRAVSIGPASHVDLTNTSFARHGVDAGRDDDGEGRPDASSCRDNRCGLSEVTREFVGASEKVDRLMPGQTARSCWTAGGATAEVTAVILEDGTSAGDRETIASVWIGARQRDELRAVVQVFDAVLPSTHGAAALEDLGRRFARQSSPDESPAHRAAREAVEAYRQRSTAANVDAIDQLLRKYADIVRREYELADKHSHPRN